MPTLRPTLCIAILCGATAGALSGVKSTSAQTYGVLPSSMYTQPVAGLSTGFVPTTSARPVVAVPTVTSPRTLASYYQSTGPAASAKPFTYIHPAPTAFQRYPSLRRVRAGRKAIWWVY